MVDRTFDYLVLGAGVAGTTAVETLREADRAADIGLVSDEPHLMYYRPRLPGYVAGAVALESILERDRSWARARRLTLYQPAQVVGLDPSAHTVTLGSGRELGYRRLLVATGARARRLDVPGEELSGVHSLWSLADAERLRAALPSARRAVVVGGGFIAAELLEAFSVHGLELTYAVRGPRWFFPYTDATAGAMVAAELAEAGITSHVSTRVAAIVGEDGHVTSVRLAPVPEQPDAPPIQAMAPGTDPRSAAPAPRSDRPGPMTAADSTNSGAGAAEDQAEAPHPEGEGQGESEREQERAAELAPLAEDETHQAGGGRSGAARAEWSVPAQLVTASLGARWEMDWFTAAGGRLGRGALTDEWLRTGLPDIWAAGDAADPLNPRTGARTKTFNVYTAGVQGRMAALGMLDRPRQLQRLPWYGFRVLGLFFTFIGMIDTRDPTLESWIEQDPAEGRYTRVFLRDRRVAGALLVNSPLAGVIRRYAESGERLPARPEIVLRPRQ